MRVGPSTPSPATTSRPVPYPVLTTDVALSYDVTNHLQLSLGSSNLFNVYPTQFTPFNTETGGVWDPVQMGSNGRQLFAKLQARF